MKYAISFSQWIAGIMVSLLLLTMSIGMYAYNNDLYMKLYMENGVLERTGMDEANLAHVTDGLIAYMVDDAETLNMTAVIRGEKREVFNKREKDHMIDVKNLFLLNEAMRGVLIGAVLFFVGLALWRKQNGYIYKVGVKQAFVSLFLAGGLLIVSMTDFSSAFIKFHQVFFTNDLWILDPRTDTLIQMLPEPFFQSMAVRMFGTWLGASLLAGVAGALMDKKTGENQI
tara:strand:- start:71 stop:754 length:684 start_codon:yes stop_codon:yes gene_type:complete